MDNLINHFLDILIKLLSLWPYLILTIPFAVIINISGGGEYIRRVTSKRPIIAIILATLIGAFSPLCSCGVIPVIASLLLGGAPMAPVMSFWIASPSMDPEIFFLSAGLLGWDLAIWRMTATLIMSLFAGLLTHRLAPVLVGQEQLLSRTDSPTTKSIWKLSVNGFRIVVTYLRILFRAPRRESILMVSSSGFGDTIDCCSDDIEDYSTVHDNLESADCDRNCDQCNSVEVEPEITMNKIMIESLKASGMVLKFMLLAIVVQTLINTFIPTGATQRLLGGNTFSSLGVAAVISVPFYTSNLTALPMMSSLIEQGLNPAITLVFLIAGPTTTLPAMAAVWGLVNRRIFLLYVSIPFAFALITGVLYQTIN